MREESLSYYWAEGIIYWYKRNEKYYLTPDVPTLPFESWGGFYVFNQAFIRGEIRLELRRKKSIKGTHYQWVTREQIIKKLGIK